MTGAKNLRLKGSEEKWSHDKATEGERAPSNFPFFLSRRDTCRRPFITYSVPIARLEIMRYIRTKGDADWRGVTLIQDSM